MRILGNWLDPPRRLLSSFILLLLLPGAAVVWLGVQLLDQDRQLAAQHLRERREIAADRAVAEIERAVFATERRLAATPPDLPILRGDDAVLVTMDHGGVAAQPPDHLLYEPELRPPPPEPAAPFADAEVLEFRVHDLAGAARAYTTLTGRSLPKEVRAGAFLRLARTLRQLDRAEEALRAYDELARLPDTFVSALPADLVARRARATLLDELGRREDLRAAADALQADLLARRWRLDLGSFDAYLQQTEVWLGSHVGETSERRALSAAVAWLWQERGRDALARTGRHSLPLDGQSLTLLWQSSSERLVALVAGPRFRQREWIDAVTPRLEHRDLEISLAASAAESPGSHDSTISPSVLRRTPAETGLPWTVVVRERAGAADPAVGVSRRRALATGLALLFAVVLAGGHLMARSVARELAVARLQSDFVAAVSHEFRTPLTSLLQFTTLLRDDDALPAVKRHAFYDAQARAVRRLAHLVESLLDFGRMEANAHPYRMGLIDATALVAELTDEFQHEAAAAGFTVEYSADADHTWVQADREALSRAVRNLLENALKYSGAGRRIVVHVTDRLGIVAISVRDEGLGIPRHEQRQIFQKFVRGSASHHHRIHGTGIGLAMVRHIVTAHGGRVTVDSAPGRGSTFTIRLPAARQAPVADNRCERLMGSHS